MKNNLSSIKRSLLSLIMLICMFFFANNYAKASECVGKFVNPITDICWSCIFPITLGPATVNSGGREDYKEDNTKDLLCQCDKGLVVPIPGIPGGFWEPTRLIDVTRKPYCMVNLGGISLNDTAKKHGSVSKKNGNTKRGSRRSFYQIHMYMYPLIYWLELLTDFACLQSGTFDIAYLSELDPSWTNESLSAVMHPESIIFSNKIAQLACSADCASATSYFPRNELFWCAGCQGAIYPYTGNVPYHSSGVQASQLLIQRLISKLHKLRLMMVTSGSDNYTMCYKRYAPIKKSQYKVQMTYPIPTASGMHACNPIGRSEVIQGSGKEFPYQGEDFGYLIWRKRNCCIL